MKSSKSILIGAIVLAVACWIFAQIIGRDIYVAVAAILLAGGILYCKLDKIHKLLKDQKAEGQKETEE